MRTFAHKQNPTQEAKSTSSARAGGALSGQSHEVKAILHLQRTIGNQAVQRLMHVNAENPEVGSGTSAKACLAHDFSQIPLHPQARTKIQPKLMVSTPGDTYEQEADRVANQVMRMSEPRRYQACACDGGCPRCRSKPKGHGEKEHSRTSPTSLDSSHLPGEFPSLKGAGKPLPKSTIGFFGSRFGHDFSQVRVHADTRGDAAAQAVNARAFTVGADVVFRRGEFAPHTQPGRTLLAHELAHVAQREHRQPQLFRQAAIEPHYPTEDEQREIEKAMSRELGKTEATPPAAPGEPAEETARSLDAKEREALVEDLIEPYFRALDSLDTGPPKSSGNVLNEADAFGVAQQARKEILKRFGRYATRRINLTKDKTTTRLSRKKADQVLVVFQPSPTVTRDLASTAITATNCKKCVAKLAGLDTASRKAVIDALVLAALKDRGELLRRVASARVPGSYSHLESRARLIPRPREKFYHTAVHELIHALAHPAFHAAFHDERNINEGFTEYFTQQVVVGVDPSYKKQYNKAISVRDAMKGPFRFAKVGGAAIEESMRLAYFRGRLDLIGWQARDKDEREDVKEASKGFTKEWDAAAARRYVAKYRSQAQAKQGASRNVLGVGLYFTKGADDKTIAVRYTRVLGRTEPYAKGQFLLEGQLLGSPVKNPDTLGASIGIAAEYQEPYIYASGGLRFVGTKALADGTGRLDVSPFVGVGIRAWQTIRVGAEGFVLLPLTGQDIRIGGGITLGVEL